MAERESALVPQAAADGPVAHSTVQQAHGVTTNHGNVVLAGGNVTFQTNYHGHPQPNINIADVLRLVPNLRKIHLDVLSKATPGTAVWILRTKNFLLWLDPNGNLKILWGTGIPGAGKSVMASVVINNLEARATASGGSACVAYVYFRYSDAVDLTVRVVLEILVKQTVERHPDCAVLAQQIYARHLSESTRPTEAELLQLLHQFTEVKSVTFYILDALDEAPEKLQVDIVRTLATLNVKLFITSRPLKAVEAKVPRAETHSFTIVAQGVDLDLHIAREISRSRDLEDLLDADPSFKEEVTTSVKKNCGGMFLHASLQLDAIARCSSVSDVLETLEHFPSDIEDVYHQTWRRICNQSPKNVLRAKAVLVWVLTATRSMTIEELRHVIATHPDTHKLERKQLVSAATLATMCCGLVTVEEETKLVRLVHYTAKATLEELLHESFPHPHSLLAAVCMTHLCECGFQDTTIGSEKDYIAALKGDPLLAYASNAWATHARMSLDVVESHLRTANFISGCKAFPSFTDPDRTRFFDIISPLHILALHGLPLSLIVQRKVGDPNVITRAEKASPLLLAFWRGNVSLIEDLLCLEGIGVNLIDKDGMPLLMLAARKGREGVVKLFLAHSDIQVNLVDKNGWSALMLAASEGHEGVVRILIAHPDTQVNSADHNGWSALMKAVSEGHKNVIKLLLAHPDTQINSVDNAGYSALILASSKGHEGVVKLLFAHHDVLVNLVDNQGRSALILAASVGHEGVVKLFLAHPEVQVNLVDKQGRTALMLAARWGHKSTVQLLLAHPDTRVNSADNNGWWVLMLAASEGHEGVVEILLAHLDIQVNSVSNKRWSALVLATCKGYKGVVKLLLAHPDIQVNSVDHPEYSALILAASVGHEDVVELLLAHPATRVNVADSNGGSALVLAVSKGYEGVVKLLLAHPDTQVNSVDNAGWSALMMAAALGDKNVAELLLAHSDVHVNLGDKEGRSALMLAARWGHKSIVKLFLGYPKIQVDQTSIYGETALVLASKYGHEGVTQLLSTPRIRNPTRSPPNEEATLAVLSGQNEGPFIPLPEFNMLPPLLLHPRAHQQRWPTSWLTSFQLDINRSSAGEQGDGSDGYSSDLSVD